MYFYSESVPLPFFDPLCPSTASSTSFGAMSSTAANCVSFQIPNPKFQIPDPRSQVPNFERTNSIYSLQPAIIQTSCLHMHLLKLPLCPLIHLLLHLISDLVDLFQSQWVPNLLNLLDPAWFIPSPQRKLHLLHKLHKLRWFLLEHLTPR